MQYSTAAAFSLSGSKKHIQIFKSSKVTYYGEHGMTVAKMGETYYLEDNMYVERIEWIVMKCRWLIVVNHIYVNRWDNNFSSSM